MQLAKRISRRLQLKPLALSEAEFLAQSRDDLQRLIFATWAYWELDMLADIREYIAIYDYAVGMFIERCTESVEDAAFLLIEWQKYKEDAWNLPRTYDARLAQIIDEFKNQQMSKYGDERLLWLFAAIALTYELRCEMLGNMGLEEHLKLVGFPNVMTTETVSGLMAKAKPILGTGNSSNWRFESIHRIG